MIGRLHATRRIGISLLHEQTFSFEKSNEHNIAADSQHDHNAHLRIDQDTHVQLKPRQLRREVSLHVKRSTMALLGGLQMLPRHRARIRSSQDRQEES